MHIALGSQRHASDAIGCITFIAGPTRWGSNPGETTVSEETPANGRPDGNLQGAETVSRNRWAQKVANGGSLKLPRQLI